MNEYSSYTAPGTTTALPISYNARGDLTCDGKFNYTYDAEDRMMSAESVTLSSAAVKLTFTYDSESRRTSETVWSGYNTVTMTYATSTTTTFAYNGDEMIAEFDANGHMTESFTWGADMSGTPDGAGGIGGLLSLSTYNSSGTITATYHPFYDGNGNVMGLTDSNNCIVATYTYSAFGRLTSSTWSGPGTTDPNPFGYQTSFTDRQTDNKVRGVRILSSLGFWTTRDPSGEGSDVNLTRYCQGDPINETDPNGTTIRMSDSVDMQKAMRTYLTENNVEFSAVHNAAGDYSGHPTWANKAGDVTSEILAKMISSPHLFIIKGGTLDNLKLQVQTRLNIIARTSSDRIVLSGDVKMNTTYWDHEHLKRGVSYFAALQDAKQSDQSTGCQTATDVAFMGGIADTYLAQAKNNTKDAATKFDRDTTNRVNGPGQMGMLMKRYESSAIKIEPKLDRDGHAIPSSIPIPKNIIPGDFCYLKNTKFGKESNLLAGENMIYVGGDMYWGVGSQLAASPRPFQAWAADVYDWDQGAEFQQIEFPSTGLE